MKKWFLVFLIGYFLFSFDILAASDVSIQVRFLRATWSENQVGLTENVILSTSSSHNMASLKVRPIGLDDVLTTAVVEILMDTIDLQAMDDLFAFKKIWDEKDSSLSNTIFYKQVAFRFIFNPERLPSRKIKLKTIVFKSKESLDSTEDEVSYGKQNLKVLGKSRKKDQMEIIFNKELLFHINELIVIGIPSENCGYFMMILLTSGIPGTDKMEFSGGPKPIQTLMPVYPDELRRQGVEGEVQLKVLIDEEGIVQYVKLIKPLHPYLDNAAVQALRQWKYEPVLQDGNPVPAVITTSVNFNREAWRHMEEMTKKNDDPSPDWDSASGSELQMILDKSAEYCQKLSNSALEFVCEEKIKEIHYNVMDAETAKKWAGIAVANKDGTVTTTGWFPIMDHERTEKNKFVCDYMLIKKEETIEERRVVLKENGRKLTAGNKLLKEKRYSVLSPIFASIRLLGQNRQPLFVYRLLDKEKIIGREVYVVEALPKSGNVGGIEYGKIWVDKNSYQILKSEIQGVPLEGYEDVLEDSTLFNLKPIFTTTYFYKVKRNEIFFPSRTMVRVAYPGLGYRQTNLKKLKIDINYDKYKFFKVETRTKIIR